ncbi:hypothetical protein [Burkholderia gladioli]|uniref:hypothetical protein n=1 Tax=Burkholderia gladioli TaxID=28095 RepID=UPI00163E6B9C|nr:hypothetical protein [Burkholderia gladioli]
MKKIITVLTAISISAGYAYAAGDEQYVLSKKLPENGIIKISSMLYMLDPSRPCPYDFPSYKSLHPAFIYNPALTYPIPGCWGFTQDPSRAGAIVLGKDGSVSPELNLMNLYRVELVEDGGKVIGPVMTYDQYQKNIADYKKQTR